MGVKAEDRLSGAQTILVIGSKFWVLGHGLY